MSSPTQRSLAHLRKSFTVVDVVERWIPPARIRRDFAGIADIIACDPGVLACQTTSGSNFAARVKKIAESEHLPALLRAGVRVVVHGWTKRANGRYELREHEF